MIKNLSKPFCWTYIKNQKATERFNSTVSDIEIIKNFLPTPDWVELLTPNEIDTGFIKKELIANKFISSFNYLFLNKNL